MNKPPKVLLGIVTYEGKDYIFKEFWANIQNLTYPNYEVLIVDNSPTKKYYSKLKRMGVPVVHVNRGATSREAHEKSLNKIRKYMLKNDFDYWMSIESDLLPPQDIIQRLISHDKDVVGCMYNIGYPDSKTEPPRPCIFVTEVDEKESTIRGETCIRTRNLNDEEGFALYGSGVVPIHGCGFGTTLVKRNIIEKIKFKYDLTTEKVIHSDVLFYMDLHNSSIQAYIDTDIIIPHHNSNWIYVNDI